CRRSLITIKQNFRSSSMFSRCPEHPGSTRNTRSYLGCRCNRRSEPSSSTQIGACSRPSCPSFPRVSRLGQTLPCGLNDGAAGDYRVLGNDDDAVPVVVLAVVAFLARKIVDADSAALADSCVLVDYCALDQGSPADSNVRYALAAVFQPILRRLVPVSPHADNAVQTGAALDEGSNADNRVLNARVRNDAAIARKRLA